MPCAQRLQHASKICDTSWSMVATAETSILDSRFLLNPNGGCKRTSLHSDYLLSFKKVLKVSVITATLPSTSPKIATSVIVNVWVAEHPRGYYWYCIGMVITPRMYSRKRMWLTLLPLAQECHKTTSILHTPPMKPTPIQDLKWVSRSC